MTPLVGQRRSRRPFLTSRRASGAATLARHMVILALLVIMLYPLAWMVASSFRPNAEIFNSPGLVVDNFTLENYRQGWSPFQGLNFSRVFLNSVVVSALAVTGNVLSCSAVAYAFARMSFPFRKTLFGIMLGAILLPYEVLIIPQYILFNELGWVGTYIPLILPRFLAVDAFFIFLMVQFIRSLPRDLDEAARIDGCGHFRIFYRIVLPLSKPALATTAMLTFVISWNDFLGPLLYLSKPDMYTVPLALGVFVDSTSESAYGALFAMCTLSLIPLVGFFLASQRLLTEGIATTGFR